MSDPEQFVEKFISFWENPSTQRLPEILHPDVVLLQPLAKPMRGIAAAMEEFERIWKWAPDMRAQIDRWCGDGDLLFVEFRLRAHIGIELVEWPNIDRFCLQGDRAIERMNYFDPMPLLPKLAKQPSTWASWLTSGVLRPWRSGHTMAAYSRSTAQDSAR